MTFHNLLKYKNYIAVALLFVLAYGAGYFGARAAFPAPAKTVEVFADGWGLSFQQKNQAPVARNSSFGRRLLSR
jgi:hypothetical protein